MNGLGPRISPTLSAVAPLVAPLVVSLLFTTPLAGQGNPSPFELGLVIAEQSRPSFSIIGAGARAAGMGGAFTALADDASAASFNPAGLALLLVPEVSVVANGKQISNDYRGFVGIEADRPTAFQDSSSEFDDRNLNFAAFTLPFKVAERNLCLQLSYHRLIEFAVDERRAFGEIAATTAIGRYSQVVHQEGDIHTLSLATAYQLTQRLSLGVNVASWRGSWQFDTYDEAEDLIANPNRSSYFRFQQDNELEGWSWSAGGLLRYRYLNVGMLYRFPFEATLTTGSKFETNIATTVSGQPRARYPLHWPSSWTLGVALKPTESWTVTTDYARYNWAEMEIRDVAGIGSMNFFDFEPTLETTTRNVGDWRVGTELRLFAGRSALLAFRAGWMREEQPQQSTARDKAKPVTGYTAGLGAKYGPVAVDLAFQWRDSSDVVVQFVDPRIIAGGGVQAVAFGTKETQDRRVYLSLLFQLPADTAGFLFVGPKTGDAE